MKNFHRQGKCFLIHKQILEIVHKNYILGEQKVVFKPAHCLLPTAYRPLPTAHRLPPTAHRLPNPLLRIFSRNILKVIPNELDVFFLVAGGVK